MNFGEKFSGVIFVMFLISNYLISSNPFLNDYGHIQSSQDEQAFDFFFADEEYLVNIEGKILKENSSQPVLSGIYYSVLKQDGKTVASKKMMLLK